MTRADITKKLVTTYSSLIVCDGDCVCFDETVGNMSEAIMRDFTENKQKGIFGMIFANEEDCYYYLLNDLSGLEEACQEFVWSKQ